MAVSSWTVTVVASRQLDTFNWWRLQHILLIPLKLKLKTNLCSSINSEDSEALDGYETDKRKMKASGERSKRR